MAVLASHLSFTDAAEKILVQSGAKTPLHYKEITKRALASNLIETDGLTPAETLRVAVKLEIDRQTKQGKTTRFVRHGNGLIGLSAWLPKGLVQQIDQHNAAVRKSLHQQLLNMPPKDFESLIGELLVSIGFENVVVSKFSGDGGIDARATLVVGNVINVNMAIQVKRWKHNVQLPTVTAVRGALGVHDHGLIVTTSDFSPGARTEAQRLDATPVALMNGSMLIDLLVENEIGVERSAHDLLELKP